MMSARSAISTPAPAARPRWWMPLLLIAAGLLVYLHSLDGPFIFDDDQILLNFREVEHQGNLTELLTATRRPLAHLTLWVNYQLGGEEPSGYRLTNIAIHLVASLALLGLIRRTLLRPPLQARFAPIASMLAFAIALFWVVHPLNTQAVTYTVQRMESMMGMCMFLTLYCAVRHLEAMETSNAARSLPWFLAAVAFSLAGMLTKEVMVVVPVVVLLYDWCLTRDSLRDLLRKRGLLYVLLALTTLPLFLLGSAEGDASAGFGMETLAPWQYALSQPLIILKYLKLSIWPHPLVLDYMHQAEHTRFHREDVAWTISFIQVAVPMLLITAAVAVTAWGVYGRKAWAFTAGAFFIVLAPTSSIMPIADLMFEHRMYVPLAAVVVLVVLPAALLWQRLSSTMRPVAAIALILIPSLALGVTTFQRNEEYRDKITIWQTVVERRPTNPRGWHHLGSAFYAQSDLEMADLCWQQTLALSPRGFPEAYANMARLRLDQHRIDEARKLLDEALRLQPDDGEFHYAMGQTLVHAGDLEGATASFHRALSLKPMRIHAKTRVNLGLIHLQQQRPDEGLAHLQQALIMDDRLDRDADVHNALGQAQALLGDLPQAEFHFMQTLHLNPQHAHAPVNLLTLSRSYGEAGRFDDAARVTEHALAILQSRGVDPRQLQMLLPVLQAYREGHMPRFEAENER